MKINTNLNVLFTNKASNRNQSATESALQRLSSGLRVNSAKDDAAGLAISERFTSQVRGMTVAMRNANDAISMLQTTEGGLEEVSGMLQRMRELSIQAANTATVSADDRRMIQGEVDQLVAEVDRIAKNAEFNGVKILNEGAKFSLAASGTDATIVQGLARAWLRESEDMITTYFGITPNAVDLTVDLNGFTDGAGSTVARVGAVVGAGVGNATNITLQIDKADFTDVTVPGDGGYAGAFAYDRIIAHEMVHAVMDNQVDMSILSDWFKEGAAELIHGADERVIGDYATATTDGVDATDFGADGINLSVWASTSAHYSKAYLAARYLHSIAAGGISAVMDQLQLGQTLDQAITTTTGIASEAAFLTQFNATASFSAASFLDTDTGAIGGGNADGGARDTTATNVVPNTDQLEANPTGFNVIFPIDPMDSTTTEGYANPIFFQVGANAGDTLQIGLASATAEALAITDLDLVQDAQTAITTLDLALEVVGKQRARLGAQANRLASTIRITETNHENISASRSRILDADFAVETAELTRSQIVSQASMAMMVQAQASSNLVLSLLNPR